MGNQNCQSEKTIRFSLSKQSLSQFEVIENRSDSIYGDIFVVKDPDNSINLAVRQKMFTSERSMQEYARKLLKFKKSSHKNLVEIKKVQHTSSGGQLCKGQGVVCVALEYFPRSLRAEHLRRRLCRNLAFSSEELLLILKSLVSALAFMQIHRRQHGRICLDFIFVNDEGGIKLLDPQYVDAEPLMDYFLIRPEEVIQAGFFVSPSQMETLANISQRSRGAKEQEDVQNCAFKADVFTLGCVILQLASNQNLADVFDYTNFFVCADSLAQHIQKVRQQHSEQLADIIQIMTCFQDKSRPDFIDLAQHLGILTSKQQSVTILSEINQQSIEGNIQVNSQLIMKYLIVNQVTTEQTDSRNTFSHKNQQPYSPTFLLKEPNHPNEQLIIQKQDYPLPSFTGQDTNRQRIAQNNKNNQINDENKQYSSVASKEKKQNYSSLNSSYSSVSLSPTPCKPISLSYTRSYAPEQTGDLGSLQIARVQECTTTSFFNFEKKNDEKSNKLDQNTDAQQQPSIFICDNYEDDIRSNKTGEIQVTGRQIIQEQQLIQNVQYQHLENSKGIFNGMSYSQEDCLMESVESPHTNAIQRMKSKRNPFNISGQLQDSDASAFLREYEGELCNYPNKQLPIFNQQVDAVLDQDAASFNQQTQDLQNQHIDQYALKFVNETYPDNSFYVGYSFNDLRHGQGQMLYSDGGRYDGQWKYGKMNGNGILYYNNNEIAYEGTFKDDKFHGQGKLMNYPSPTQISNSSNYNNNQCQDLLQVPWLQYQGEFQDDKIEGEGLMLFTDNRKYYGHFSNGFPNGQGILFDKDDQVIKKGIWAQGKLISILS